MTSYVTVEPVTLSGWYTHTDGTVGYYCWRHGLDGNHPRLAETVSSWAAVRRRDLERQWEDLYLDEHYVGDWRTDRDAWVQARLDAEVSR